MRCKYSAGEESYCLPPGGVSTEPRASGRPWLSPPCTGCRGVMDGRGAGGLSGLIDEVRADRRRLTRGGWRRARAGGRAQTRRRSRSAPGRRQRPTGAPRPGSRALEAEPGAPLPSRPSEPGPWLLPLRSATTVKADSAAWSASPRIATQMTVISSSCVCIQRQIRWPCN